MIYIYPELKYFIATDEKSALEGIRLAHIQLGEKVGIGYPYAHNVYRVNQDGELRFSYHYYEEVHLCKNCY